MAGQGISLISEDERYVYAPVDGVKITYRRAGDREIAQWTEKYTDDRDKKLDVEAYGRAVIKFGILSWEGVFDPDEQGKLAEITPDNYARLPRWMRTDLSDLIASNRRGYTDVPLAVSPTGSTSS